MYLEEIIEDVQLESDKFEAKGVLNRDDVVGWLKSIAGFANASGGEFYIGVEDKTNKLIGFDRRNADNERNYFNNQANEHLTPRPAMKISFVRYEINGNERFIIKVIVEESAVKPVILKYKNIPSIFMRRDGFTNGATYEEIIEMSVKSKNTQYDILVSDVKYNWDKLLCLRALPYFLMIIRKEKQRYSVLFSRVSTREVKELLQSINLMGISHQQLSTLWTL